MPESAHLPVFYAAPLPAVDRFTLDGDEGHHAAKVRRLRVGERLRVADAAGSYADCVVEVAGQRSLDLLVESRGDSPVRSPRLVVIQALPKGDRSALAVELLTEIGVDEIVPWQASHCVARWDGKEAKARDRWEHIAREAAKQSRRTTAPTVGELIRGPEVAARCQQSPALVLHESATDPIADISLDRDADELVIVVGPEGGIAPGELDALHEVGAVLVRLGPEVLRTSSAGLAGATWASIALGRWS